MRKLIKLDSLRLRKIFRKRYPDPYNLESKLEILEDFEDVDDLLKRFNKEMRKEDYALVPFKGDSKGKHRILRKLNNSEKMPIGVLMYEKQNVEVYSLMVSERINNFLNMNNENKELVRKFISDFKSFLGSLEIIYRSFQ